MYQMIKHVMADGTIRDSVAGLTVPKESRAYEVLQRIKGGDVNETIPTSGGCIRANEKP